MVIIPNSFIVFHISSSQKTRITQNPKYPKSRSATKIRYIEQLWKYPLLYLFSSPATLAVVVDLVHYYQSARITIWFDRHVSILFYYQSARIAIKINQHVSAVASHSTEPSTKVHPSSPTLLLLRDHYRLFSVSTLYLRLQIPFSSLPWCRQDIIFDLPIPNLLLIVFGFSGTNLIVKHFPKIISFKISGK